MWVPPEDPAALSEAVLRFKRDRDHYEECAGKSLAAAHRYSREEKAREMIEVIQRVVKGLEKTEAVDGPVGR